MDKLENGFSKRNWPFNGRGRLLYGLLVLTLTQCGDGEDTKKVDLESDPTLDARVWSPALIYGSDDRRDYYQVTTGTQRLADSTVALMKSSSLRTNTQGAYSIVSGSFREEMGVCATEPYADQPAAAFCSGSLVTKDIVITAGHCIQSTTDCSDVRFVFGYSVKAAGSNPQVIQASEVYKCKNIIRSTVQSAGVDYAIIRLDREVVGHTPLAVRRAGVVVAGDSLVVIGHPSGLPLKVAGNAQVRSVSATHFVANLDTYGGNSGSAVFNASTGVIEGILVRGDTDFVMQGSCRVSNRCADSSCRGEDVTRVDRVLEDFPVGELPNGEVADPPPQIPQTDVYAMTANKGIPDNSSVGISSLITASASPSGRKIYVNVEILHSYRGDLYLSLVAPDGREVILHNRSGGSADNIVGTYGKELGGVTQLAALSTIAIPGKWTLKVSDRARIDIGKLVKWSLTFSK